MSRENLFQSWIEAGYEMLATEGIESVQIEKLARHLDLNKSGFYHYFGDLDTYFEHLIKYHENVINRLIEDMATVSEFDPGYLNLLVVYKIPTLVHMQLVRNRHIKLFAEAFHSLNHKIDTSILPLWAKFLGLSGNPDLALKYYEMTHDAFFARVTPKNLDYDFLHMVASEAKAIVENLQKNKTAGQGEGVQHSR